MTLPRKLIIGLVAAAIALPATVFAQDRMMQAAVAARQGHMQNYQLNLIVLGGMARGNIEYNAENAQAAADNIVALTRLDQRFLWPQGSDSESFEGSNAKPELWQNFDDVVAKGTAAAEAAVALQAAAGQGVEAIGPALGGLGQACTACHESYQVER